MRIKLPQYTSKDYLVLGVIILPFTLIMNSVIFGANYFSAWMIFIPATIITGGSFSVFFVLCGGVAVLLKKRLPEESQVGKKLTFMILIFLLMTGLFLTLIFNGYEVIEFPGYTFNRKGFVWSYIGMGIINIFLTFLHEGIARFENWKENQKEMEALRYSYRQSQLLGLKSQVNPHFLFNSLNSLSSLISEDEDKAEAFLNEMTKVYRYMLRNDDEHLVSLQTELAFLESYMHLLKARYGDGLQINLDVADYNKDLLIPPLTLQVIIENAFTQNTMSKSCPLIIQIKSEEGSGLLITNSVQPKKVSGVLDFETGLDNLVRKYKLLNQTDVLIEDCKNGRCIHLPLISRKMEEAQ